MPIENVYKGKKLLYKFAVYRLSGTVQSENTRSETEVSGKIYGGGTNSTYGTVAPVQGEIKSETIRYQTIFLKEDDGTEHALELVDLVVPCREGHKVTLWRLGKDLWFQVHNQTTNQFYTYGKLKKLVYPKVAYFVLGILFGIYAVDKNHTGGKYLLALLFAILIGLAIATIPCGIVAWMREKAIFGAANAPNMVLAK
ncbi:hypothetical protein [Sedimenticola hydrogenitrophicus]|uniref:hypothetical protein n=1 Tax=Sedimenticola hydrogenitrophicus TaxID=2967975 RepID=UPI0021A29F85|nr:hypothetical protein [Sedimenticola hydrogenitrophicus]